ncbi:MAG: hypothetical protein Q9190_001271 [Brigantiaea leucoxantha]
MMRGQICLPVTFCLIRFFVAQTLSSKNVLARLQIRQTPAELVQPPLTSFVPQNEIDTLKTLSGQIGDWDDAAPETDFPFDPDTLKRDVHWPGRTPSLHTRFIDVGVCRDGKKRRRLRTELNAVRNLLEEVEDITADHPIWRALVADDFRDNEFWLKRFKGMVKVMYDTINDPSYTIGWSCDPAGLYCGDTRQAPGRPDVTMDMVGRFDSSRNTINVCDHFFKRAPQRFLYCKAGLPISRYNSAARWMVHELIHAVFEPLMKDNDNYFIHDLAYGFDPCVDLARGICLEAEEGIPCRPEASVANVDSLAWIINGKYDLSLKRDL